MTPSLDSEGSLLVRIRIFARVVFMIITIVLVVKFQVNRTNVTHIYRTADPLANVRNGIAYTCGCSLPPQLQGNDAPANESSLNRCYDSSELETVDILVYSNFSRVNEIGEILRDAYPDLMDFKARWKPKRITGFRVTQQGHYISWNNDKFLDNFQDLSLNDPEERKRVIPTNFLQKGEFLEFPNSYAAIAFAFNCTNCTLCPLSSVKRIFEGLETSHQPWGDCKYWARGNHCISEEHFYEAKCVMYPTAAIPLNFAVQTFLRKLLKIPGIDTISPPQSRSSHNNISFDASLLYMNFSRVSSEQNIRLNFAELPRSSPAWFQLLALFPTLDKQCNKLKKVTVCNGTSVCNLFKDAKDDGYAVLCSEMNNTSECQRDLYMNDPSITVNVDDATNLWAEFGVRKRDFSSLMCMNYTCQTAPPYSVLWQTAPVMKGDSLNWLLESKILSKSWSQLSGVCTKTYKNVIRQKINGTTVFMETRCSQNGTASQPVTYCWLTGKFYRIHDEPKARPWTLEFSKSEKLFVCYHVTKQNLFVWLIVSFGILFGWLGSIDSLFNWILFPVALQLGRGIRSWVEERRSKEETANGEGSESDEPRIQESSLRSDEHKILDSSPRSEEHVPLELHLNGDRPKIIAGEAIGEAISQDQSTASYKRSQSSPH